MEDKLHTELKLHKDDVALVFSRDGFTTVLPHYLTEGENIPVTIPHHIALATAIAMMIAEGDKEFDNLINNRIYKMEQMASVSLQ